MDGACAVWVVSLPLLLTVVGEPGMQSGVDDAGGAESRVDFCRRGRLPYGQFGRRERTGTAQFGTWRCVSGFVLFVDGGLTWR